MGAYEISTVIHNSSASKLLFNCTVSFLISDLNPFSPFKYTIFLACVCTSSPSYLFSCFKSALKQCDLVGVGAGKGCLGSGVGSWGT